MNWLPVKKLKPDKIHFQEWEGPVDDPWGAAEQYMKKGYLPPVVLCVLLTQPPYKKFTRNRAWILAGAIQTVKWMEGDTEILRKKLRKLSKMLPET